MSEEAGNDTLVAEIGEAIKSMEEPNAIEPQVEPGAETQGAETVEAPTAEKPKEPEAFVADDDLIKRGVLAGLDVADVKAFASSARLRRRRQPRRPRQRPTRKTATTVFPSPTSTRP